MTVQNLANMRIAIKAQSALGTAATGAGASGIEVVPGNGMATTLQTIESAMIQRGRMRKRPRQGSRFSNVAYQSELAVGAHDTYLQGALGGTWVAAQNFSNTDWGAVSITGTGTILTFASGTLVTDGLRAGMVLIFTNLSVAGNNSKYVPLLTVAEGVATCPSGILADNASDAAYNVTLARHIYTATPYTDRYITIEENLTDIDRSKLGTDARFNSLAFSASPNEPVGIGFGLGVRKLEMLAAGDSPHFTDPVFVDGPSLTLLDGGIYVNGTRRANLTGFTFGLEAPVSGIPVLGSNLSPDVFLGQFALTGQFTGVVEDGTDFDAFDAETQISVLLRCAEQGTTFAEDFISFYLGNLTFGGWGTQAGGEGGMIATIPLYGGEDERGTGYAPTTVLVSTSAA